MKNLLFPVALVLLSLISLPGCVEAPAVDIGEQLVNDALELKPNKVTASLMRGADVNYQLDGMTALMGACMVFHHDPESGRKIVHALLDAGADLNLRDGSGASALGWAVDSGDLQLVTDLVTHGADVTAEDDRGRTALSIAKEGNNQEMIAYLESAISRN